MHRLQEQSWALLGEHSSGPDGTLTMAKEPGDAVGMHTPVPLQIRQFWC